MPVTPYALRLWFDILKDERQGLFAFKDKFGPIVTPEQLEAEVYRSRRIRGYLP